MDRRFLFPALAATAWAQQQAPDPNVEALRDRVQQYYKLIVEKKFRQAEALVAEESKEDYYNGSKPDIKDFEVATIDLQTPTTAKVTIKAGIMTMMPLAGAHLFRVAVPSYWKIDNGQWSWYIPEETKGLTPFGRIRVSNTPPPPKEIDRKGAAPGTPEKVDVGALLNQISIDRTDVTFAAGETEKVVTITNGLPGVIEVVLNPRTADIKGIAVSLDNPHVQAAGKCQIRIRRQGTQKVNDVVSVTAEPFGQVFDIKVKAD